GDVGDELKKGNPGLGGEDGGGRIALHTAVAGIGAALGGGNVAGAIAGTVAGDLAASVVRDQVDRAVAGLPAEMRDQVAKVILNVVASAAGGIAGGTSGAGGAAASDMYNRQLHPDEGLWIKKNAKRYAEQQGIPLAQAEAELTGQAQRQADSAAAESYVENQNARAFLSQMTGTQGNGFVYFDGKADGTYDNHILFAGGIKENADLTELYDLAWKRLQAGLEHPSNLTGSNRALADATLDVANYVSNPAEIAKVAQALQDERAKAEAAGSAEGIYTYRYQIPAYDSKGNTIGYKANEFVKTVYDPAVFTDQKILEFGQKAAAIGYEEAIRKGESGYDSAYGGITFRVYLDKGVVQNFHPK
uniref:CdiA family toxin C-terminal domain-containing protein n=1 Tax=Streptomyces virginiae TaxID=1961 RepID=UPI0035DE905D